ncbi:Tetratricopeptide-like helical [Artemisia annua]|uniref:Tetratricopeptide-like helical n=1 Tax=Artemisia annua TaxID=35608 RepID=A0A2U1M123_ARTAN|nr:Tetratricopeptide-like helical [Artemisia annua]
MSKRLKESGCDDLQASESTGSSKKRKSSESSSAQTPTNETPINVEDFDCDLPNLNENPTPSRQPRGKKKVDSGDTSRSSMRDTLASYAAEKNSLLHSQFEVQKKKDEEYFKFIDGEQQNQQQLLQHHNRESSFVLSTEIDGSSSSSKLSQGVVEADEDMLMSLAHQKYKSGDFRLALDHSQAVYDRNPSRTDNLLLMGAIYYQLHDFDMCIAKNEEALRIDRNFAECYGNMANAWKEKGNIDVAIRYYLVAIEEHEGSFV